MDEDLTLRIAAVAATTLFVENMLDENVDTREFLIIANHFMVWLEAHESGERGVALEALNASVVVTGQNGSKSMHAATERADVIRGFLTTGNR